MTLLDEKPEEGKLSFQEVSVGVVVRESMDSAENSGEPSRPPYLTCVLLALSAAAAAGVGLYFLLSAPTLAANGARVFAHPSDQILVSVSFSERDEVRAVDLNGQAWTVVEGALENRVDISLHGQSVEKVVESGPWVALLMTSGDVTLFDRVEGNLDSLRAREDLLALEGGWVARASVGSDTVTLLCQRTKGPSWFAAEEEATTVVPARGGGCQSLALRSGLLAVGNGSGQVTVFDAETRELRAELSAPVEAGDGSSVVALAFSEDATELAAALESHLVVWSLEKEEVTLYAPIQGAPLTSVACDKGLYLVGDSAGAVTFYGAGGKGRHWLFLPYQAELPTRPPGPVTSIALSGWRFAWCVNDQLFVFDLSTIPIRIRKGGKTSSR